MLTLQLSSVICLGLHLMSWGRGVQGAFHIKSLGEKREYFSHDLVGFFKPIAEEHANLETEDISVPHKWDNPFNPPEPVIQIENHQQIQHDGNVLAHSVYMSHKDLFNHPSNFHDMHKYYPENPLNAAPVEVFSFFGPNNQKENYPHEGPSKYQTSSSNTIVQPMIDRGLRFNLAPYFDGFQYPDISLVPQIHQNSNILRTELTLGNSAFHFIQKDSLKIPQISKMINRELDERNNLGHEVLNLNPLSTIQISGPINADNKIGQLSNSIDNESSSLINSKKRKRKVTKLELKAIESFEERLDLIRVLREDFSLGPKAPSQNNEIHDSKNFRFSVGQIQDPEKGAKYQRFINKKVLSFLHEHDLKEDQQPDFSISVKVKEQFTRSEISSFDNRYRSTIIESAFRIQWNGFETLKKYISNYAPNSINHKEVKLHKGTLSHIKNISIVGITFMKIIAKKYPKGSISEEFEDDQRLIVYNNLFWDFCFKNREDIRIGLRDFFKSIRGNSSEKDIDRFVSAELSRKRNKPEAVFSIIKTIITTKIDRKQLLLLSWYFAFLRAMVYYPELFFQSSLEGNQLKTFIENGIMYFIQKYDKI
ncbi:hypothetical protein PPACK8108_LOCUS704 [Phakopsora pachyrhizi]|uniref:Uncharacterized protein n=1 Tax=Phakopsora pachyrhizi TaxID=170000 RepID=A0AAV0AGS1_PHAPC|nr:hypothetical protein PPACK8108_LOCUS704 [Phakopsora pachyrhizi]